MNRNETSNNPLAEFKIKGYPIIKVYENYFEIKAIDFWEFRKFFLLSKNSKALQSK